MKQGNEANAITAEAGNTRRRLSSIRNISVIGLGKLGLCVAASLACKGYSVYGVDIDPRKTELINRGVSPICELMLGQMLRECKQRLTVGQDYDLAVENSDATFVIVNTPSNPDGSYSLEQLLPASKAIGLALKKKRGFHLVVITSTVLPGTLDESVQPLLEQVSRKKCGVDFGLCYNPEFIALGSVIHDFLNPDFVLIGESDEKSGELLAGIYRRICENNPKIVRMSPANAELTKIALNSYVTTKISFANTLAELCERLPGGDVDVVTSSIGLDSRIGSRYIRGGLGFGGPCFPRDNDAFSFFAKKMGCTARIAEASDQVNDDQVKRIVKIVEERTNGSHTEIAILGLTYKPGTDVVEASQPISIALALSAKGYSLRVHDPLGLDNARRYLGDKATYCKEISNCISDARVCIVATPWDDFKKLSSKDFTSKLKKVTIIDCWRILDRKKFAEKTDYIAVGVKRTEMQQPTARSQLICVKQEISG